MKKENPNFNVNNNSGDDLFINISSTSSKNQSSKNSSNNYINEEKSSELFSLTDNSFNKIGYDISLKNNSNNYSNKSLSEDKKEISKIKMEKSNITPKRKPDDKAEFFKRSKNKNRAVLETKNINGKNLIN